VHAGQGVRPVHFLEGSTSGGGSRTRASRIIRHDLICWTSRPSSNSVSRDILGVHSQCATELIWNIAHAHNNVR
jgi:hypothetical protein